MVIKDLVKEVLDLAGVPVPDSSFLRNYNRAIYDLAMMYDTAKKPKTQTIECENPGTEYELEAGFLKINRVLDAIGGYYKAFSIRDNARISFATSGTYEVQGYAAYDGASSMNSLIEINPAYIMPIERYIAAKVLKSTDKDLSTEYLKDYMVFSEAANRNIRKVDNPNKTVASKPWAGGRRRGGW